MWWRMVLFRNSTKVNFKHSGSYCKSTLIAFKNMFSHIKNKILFTLNKIPSEKMCLEAKF